MILLSNGQYIPLCMCEIYPLHLPSTQPPISLRPWSQATGGKMLGLAASKDRWMVAGKAGEQFWYVIIVRQHTGEQGIQALCRERTRVPAPRNVMRGERCTGPATSRGNSRVFLRLNTQQPHLLPGKAVFSAATGEQHTGP